ncbi:hypothetical protein [Halosimplex sp. TS25]|uniref:hypothetical protein n=1 Tax=Halosimplex rarum TaxID=3396619 RepID=UPI0039E898E0
MGATFVPAIEDPFHAFAIGRLLRVGVALVLAGMSLLMTVQLRAVLDIPARMRITMAACMGLMSYYTLLQRPQLLEVVQLIAALTAVLAPAVATVIAVRGLLGVS